jgi:tetratricopeptide (TPR) repeat protein
MNVRKFKMVLLFILMAGLGTSNSGVAQQSVVDIFKSDATLAEQHFLKGDIKEAIRLYERANTSNELHAKIGHGYYLLKEYELSVRAYQAHVNSGKPLDNTDLLFYAEAQLALKNYGRAKEAFHELSTRKPEDLWTIKKIWRISNLHYLFEDSIHFAIRSLNINTLSGEWAAIPFKKNLIFLSNRRLGNPVNTLHAATKQPFYQIYRADEKPDTLLDGWSKLYGRVVLHEKGTGNTGSFCLYDNLTRVIFTASSDKKNAQGIKTLGLYFGKTGKNGWQKDQAFDHNNLAWSLKDPSLDTANHILYFASDKKGGYGGMDLYRSRFVGGHWTEPVNLGERINTPGDEVFPHVHQGILYFSSNGQPGMGGLDIFKVYVSEDTADEPVNLGYPINSSFDDFSITLTDTRAAHGYLSSNRKAGGLDDDIFEFDMDMQSYPFEITGIIRQMDHTWNQPLGQARILAHATIKLVDNVRKVVVQETSSDGSGVFVLRIPYFSKYAIHVRDAEGIENVAVFEVPRQRKESAVHDIVVVKDIFQSTTK